MSSSDIIAKNINIFNDKKIIVAGELLDSEVIYALINIAKELCFWTSDYGEYNKLLKIFSLSDNKAFISTIFNNKKINILFSINCFELDKNYDIGLLSITKTKDQNKHILKSMSLRLNSGLLMCAGANDEGIKGMQNVLKEFGPTQTADTARKSRLFITTPKQLSKEEVEKEEKHLTNNLTTYNLTKYNLNLNISQLPGVFSAQGLDIGTEVLLDYLDKNIEEIINQDTIKILDVGCGCGIISLFLKAKKNTLDIHATDISANAIYSCKYNSQLNNLPINVFVSDMLSNASKYDLIISNPPFHNGVNVVLDATKNLFAQAKQHLTENGSILIVANSFLPYTNLLKEHFSHVEIKNYTSKFKIYHAF